MLLKNITTFFNGSRLTERTIEINQNHLDVIRDVYCYGSDVHLNLVMLINNIQCSEDLRVGHTLRIPDQNVVAYYVKTRGGDL
jgi:hypothetical protein